MTIDIKKLEVLHLVGHIMGDKIEWDRISSNPR